MSVDSRIVTMKFDNAQFEAKAKQSLSTLAKLKEAMSFSNVKAAATKSVNAVTGAFGKAGAAFSKVTQGVQRGATAISGAYTKIQNINPFKNATAGAVDLQKNTNNFSTAPITGGITAISNKWLAMATVATTVLSNITTKAQMAATAWVKGFSTAPILDGLHEYETNLKSIQTIQANTDRPLTEINASLDELNTYSDQTIYNFSEMAKNIGTFTAAGVDLQTATSSIKGIANLAALSGSSSEQAATAMYQLSQAIASGKVGLQDWNSVVNAGMGGKKLQNALAQTAVAMGKIDAAQVKGTKSGEQLTIMGQSFRESIMAKPGQQSWLESDILVNTLATMDGRFSKAALAAEENAQGLQKYSKAQIEAKIATARTNLEQKNGVKFTDEQFAALQKMSTSAFEAATKVKTLGQVFDVAKETIASGWSASFRNIFGGLDEAKELFTGMSNGLNGIIKENARARNQILANWNKKGGRMELIEGLKNAWTTVLKIAKPIKNAFRDIFPAKTGKDLVAITKSFRSFTEGLIPSKDTMHAIKSIALGVFSVFSIGGKVISAIAGMFGTLFDQLGTGEGKFLDFAAGIGDAIRRFDLMLEKSGAIDNFFQGLGSILAIPLEVLKQFGALIAGIFTGFDSSGADRISESVTEMSGGVGAFTALMDRIRNAVSSLGGYLGDIGSRIGETMAGIGDAIANSITSESFSKVLDVINTGLLAAITGMLVKFFRSGISVDATGGFFGSIVETLGGVTDTLSTMQASLKANIILKIGVAIGVLAAALFVLSTIDPGAMKMALAAMAAGFGALVGTMIVMMKYLGPAGVVQIYAVSTAMTKLATAMLILAFALKVMTSMNLPVMLRGMVGFAGVLFIISKAMVPLTASAKGMVRVSAGLLLIGIAMNLLAASLKIFATMSWQEMAKGLVGLAGSLGGIALAMRLMPKGILLQATAILILSGSLLALGTALKLFATMSWQEMGKGMAILASSLGIIAIALRAMPKGILLQAIALGAVAGALVVLGGALKIMGSFSAEAIAKSLITLAGAMAILAIGLKLMSGSLAGAAALIVAAAAITILVPALAALGSLSWDTIIKGLVALAGVFAVLGIAGLVLGPVAPVIVALSVSLLLLGAGMALVGIGALGLATAFGIFVAAGSAGMQVLGQLFNKIIQAIPPLLSAVGRGIVQFAVAIGKGAPKIGQAFGRILTSLLNMVIKTAPKLGQTFTVMLNTALGVLVRAVPRIANAGLQIIMGFLNAVGSKIGGIVDKATTLISNFIRAVGRNTPKLVDAGAKAIIDFLNGTADAIRNNSDQVVSAAANVGSAIIEGMVSAVRAAASNLADAAVDAASGALDSALDFVGLGSPLFRDKVGVPIARGMELGVRKGAPGVRTAVLDIGQDALSTLQSTMSGLSDALALDPNMNPVVTPVLDLTSLTRDASRMSAILATSPIVPITSYDSAVDISARTTASDSSSGSDDGGTSGGDTYVEIHQVNNSPKPIDPIVQYRNNKTLVATVREAVK